MRRLPLLFLLATISTAADGDAPRELIGFTPERAAAQLRLEARFDSLLERSNIESWIREYSAAPHHAGSPGSRAVAESIADRFRSWGFDTAIETYHVLLPTPRSRELELIEPVRYRARLDEPVLDEDATSSIRENLLPPYNAYSVDGDVTGELVYVNYGIPADYETLDSLGVDVAGKIVVARYGGSWRGIKPKVAAERGAIGCIIYSDPRDDGYFQGDVYPEGAYRMEWGTQRGSVADMPLYPGDPLTPFVGATREAKRLSLDEAETLTKIPVLPISYGDALPLLRAIGGPVAPPAWRGALPITYHIGPGPAKARLALAFDWNTVPAHNVIAKLRGSERPDEWILRGNHHDAWNFGAADPISGMVALMEEARAVGALAKSGWRPKRTIVYAGWDAEEQGLLGSTEWAEHHADELRRKAAVYVNTDSNGRGFLYAGASHSLERLVNQAARDVVDPQKNISVLERARARVIHGGGEGATEARERADLRVAALGSGSDYTPFIQHLGIPSMHLGFGGENGGGSYHSIYDSFDHYRRFGDPGFHYGITLAQVAGRVTLRFAEADVLPFRFSNFTETAGGYVDEVHELADSMRKETEERNRNIREGVLEAVADPKEPWVAPTPKDPVPHLELAALANAAAAAKQSAERYDAAAARAVASGIAANRAARVNAIVSGAEAALTSDEGLPRRPWFRHQIYAPGFYTGYGVKTLPGVREAIEERKWAEAEREAKDIAAALQRFASTLDRASEVLEAD
ncbi:MAG TPA: M28 family metallopeptidase [Thermoanaerobaculia bacterium]|nr:M28 family metallopeptidase [Thermoanaerobaculia bacterium]